VSLHPLTRAALLLYVARYNSSHEFNMLLEILHKASLVCETLPDILVFDFLDKGQLTLCDPLFLHWMLFANLFENHCYPSKYPIKAPKTGGSWLKEYRQHALRSKVHLHSLVKLGMDLHRPVRIKHKNGSSCVSKHMTPLEIARQCFGLDPDVFDQPFCHGDKPYCHYRLHELKHSGYMERTAEMILDVFNELNREVL